MVIKDLNNDGLSNHNARLQMLARKSMTLSAMSSFLRPLHQPQLCIIHIQSLSSRSSLSIAQLHCMHHCPSPPQKNYGKLPTFHAPLGRTKRKNPTMTCGKLLHCQRMKRRGFHKLANNDIGLTNIKRVKHKHET